MSVTRYYEFRTIDEPLTEQQQQELREISSRAEITSTSFVNEYNWGDLKAKPRRLVEEYFDAHLHITSYGIRNVMFRLPRGMLDVECARKYEHSDCLQIGETKTHHIVEFSPYMEDRGRECRRNAYLDELEGQEDELWSKVEELVADSYLAKDYDAAVSRLVDLRDLAQRHGDPEQFQRRLHDFRSRYGSRRTLMERLDDNGLSMDT